MKWLIPVVHFKGVNTFKDNPLETVLIGNFVFDVESTNYLENFNKAVVEKKSVDLDCFSKLIVLPHN